MHIYHEFLAGAFKPRRISIQITSEVDRGLLLRIINDARPMANTDDKRVLLSDLENALKTNE